MLPNPILFSGNANHGIAEKIAKYMEVPLGDVEIRHFSDDEIWIKYKQNIRGADIFIIQPTNSPAQNILELLIMLDAAHRASAERITAVIPYFGYARQDRKDQPRVSISAKLVANLIATAGADRVLTMDLHAPQIQGFFDIPVDHLYSSTILSDHFKAMKVPELTVVSPDIGGIKSQRSGTSGYCLTIRFRYPIFHFRRDGSCNRKGKSTSTCKINWRSAYCGCVSQNFGIHKMGLHSIEFKLDN